MSSTKSRAERLAETLIDPDCSDASEELFRNSSKRTIDRENQQFWALYEALDVSQSDVADLVGPRVKTSQSTVSRAIREKKDEVVHDEDALDLVGALHEDDVEPHPDEWLTAYRQVLAEAKADVVALHAIVSFECDTPEWAAQRFPELVGCHKQYADKFNWKGKITDDSRLNRLDSVNTDRWD